MAVGFKKLHRWQHLIVGGLGFVGICATIAFQGWAERKIKIEEENRQAQSVALGLYVEAATIAEQLRDIERSLNSHEKSRLYFIAQRLPTKGYLCKSFASELAKKKVLARPSHNA